MRFDFFTIPVIGGEDAADALNRLVGSVRVLSVDRQFVADGTSSCWAVCVLSQGGGQRPPGGGRRSGIDYREVLSEADFGVFARLRELRKELANRDGVPPYSVFTNEQLAQIVRRRATSISALREIEGVGEARADKYGAAILDIMTRASSVSEGRSDAP